MWCDPPDMETVQNGIPGLVICNEGSRYCRDEAWSDCEILWDYATFVPN
jgi:hypothetical protein